MTALRNWLFGVIAVCAVLSIMQALLPKGKFQTIIRCAGAVVLLFALLKPFIQADWEEMARSYSDWRWELSVENENYQVVQNEELESLIAKNTAAYIEEKAASLGVVCHAQIECAKRDGVPFPTEIVLNIPYSEELSQLIEHDLDIKADSQHWQEDTK